MALADEMLELRAQKYGHTQREVAATETATDAPALDVSLGPIARRAVTASLVNSAGWN
jgi:hypothetical protein